MNKKRLYKYLVTELIKDHIKNEEQIDMYFSCMDNVVSLASMTEAVDSALKAVYKENEAQAKINVYVQQPSHQVLLQAIDYVLWCVFRFYEQGEPRYMDFMADKIKLVKEMFKESHIDKKNET